jgi:hypothetical protein
MSGFISKQPNGLYCRFSTITDCPTDWNMTKDDYINLCVEKAKQEANDILDGYLQPFSEVVNCFAPNNMTKQEFKKFLEETK